MAVIIAYAYPYAQVICLRESPGYVAWPGGGLALVNVRGWSESCYTSYFGKIIWGPSGGKRSGHQWTYRFVRHPMYLSYILADIGYNLEEWNLVTLLLY